MKNAVACAMLAVCVLLNVQSALAQTRQGFASHVKASSLPPGAQQYNWAQGDGPVRMMAVKDGICGLVVIQGVFRGGGEYVRIENVGGFWQLSGASQQRGVFASARCVPMNLFQTTSTITHHTNSIGVRLGLSDPSKIFYQEVLSDTADDSWCWLTGVGGNLGPYIGTVVRPGIWVGFDSTPAGDFDLITAQAAHRDTYLEGSGACISSPKRLKVASGGGPLTPGDQIGVKMTAMKVGICFLTRVGGNFDSEWDLIRINVNRWGMQSLGVHGQNWGLAPNYSRTPIGEASCVAYDQR
jgi:hypothetical protein